MTTKTKLDADEFVPFAPKEPGTVHIHHCKQGRNNDRLYITRKDDDSILAYCHHCDARGYHSIIGSKAISNSGSNKAQDTGSVPGDATTADDASTGTGEQRRTGSDDDKDTGRPGRFNYPDRFSDFDGSTRVSPEDWPHHAKEWWLQVGVTYAHARQLDVQYSADFDAMVVPLQTNGYLLRNFSTKKGVPKYYKSDSNKDAHVLDGILLDPFERYVPSPEEFRDLSATRSLVIVEDFRSAAKIASCTNHLVLPLLGTTLSESNFLKILRDFADVSIVIWLDNDNNKVLEKAEKIETTLKQSPRHRPSYRVPAGVSDKDPKDFNHDEIRRLLSTYVVTK